SARSAGPTPTTGSTLARWIGSRSCSQSRRPSSPPESSLVTTAPQLGRALAAETIGTFTLVFAGAGSVMVETETGSLGQVGIALTFGLVIMAMIYAVGHISGAHFNPAVTLAFALTRHFPWRRSSAYWGAQAAGAIVAALLLRASLGDIA